jgi:hypothetical protein
VLVVVVVFAVVLFTVVVLLVVTFAELEFVVRFDVKFPDELVKLFDGSMVTVEVFEEAEPLVMIVPLLLPVVGSSV